MRKRGAPPKHGASGTPELVAWSAMHRRCGQPADVSWSRYGGRGIKVCESWSDFNVFLTDMGPRPGAEFSLDRINLNGNYEPNNCRWATRIEQMNNTSRNQWLEFRAQSKTLPEWSRELGIDQKLLHDRIFRRGWSVERALTSSKLIPSRRNNNMWIECGGEKRTLSEWASISGLNPVKISRRIKKGVPSSVAIFQKETIYAKRPNRKKRRIA